jgi:hypothetical protein
VTTLADKSSTNTASTGSSNVVVFGGSPLMTSTFDVNTGTLTTGKSS